MKRKIILNLIVIFFLLIGFVIALYGVTIPKDQDIYTKIGYYVLRPYKYGLYLTQPDTDVFYNFSPNDFYITTEATFNETQKLLPTNEETISNEYELSYNSAALPIRIYYALESYFKLTTPKATFTTKNGDLVISSQRKSNELSISISGQYFKIRDAISANMAMSFNDSDIIFDEFGNLYSNTDTSDIQEINQTLGLKIKENRVDLNPTSTESKYLILLNKNLNGALKVEINSSNYSVIELNLENYLIKFACNDVKQPKIKISVIDSVKDYVAW